MIKIAYTLSLVGLTGASSSTPPTSKDAVRAVFNMKKAISMGNPATQAQVESSAAVAGDWFMMSLEDDACSGSTSTIQSYKMDVCVADSEGSSSQYNVYTCTEDSETGIVVLTQTPYSDSSCTTSAGSAVATNFPTSCTSGFTSACSDTNNFDQTQSTFSDGLFLQGYETSSLCSGGDVSNLLAFAGLRGCLEGTFYGDDSASLYLNSDCTGSVIFSFGYSSLFTDCVAFTDDDGTDDGTDDDIGGPDYGGMYISYSYGSDEDDDVCFHVESKIDYKGVEYTYEELKAGKEPECSVPHSPWSKGVIISTSCGKTVRVTDTHLMATTKGFQLAYSLKPGDVLFGDYGNEMCTVKTVEKEKSPQQYFGLNCVHSEVLASGLRASTFGDFHTLPSWYMTYVGGVVGTDTASYLGDYIAEWFFKK